MKKRMVFVITSLVIVILISSWLFPFSFVSWNKEFPYSPDPKFLEQYRLRVMEQNDRIESEDKATQKLLELLNHPFLFRTKTDITRKDIKILHKEIEYIKEIINSDYLSKKYNEDQRENITIILESLNLIDDNLTKMDAFIHTKFSLQKDFYQLHIQLYNLHLLVNNLYDESE